MAIPYNLIHSLENEYGTLALVPENNLTLKSIQKTLYDNEEEIIDAKITTLINDGYSISEIATELNFSQNKIRSAVNRLGLEVKPYFKYVAINRKTGQKIYSKNFSKYRVITHQPLQFISSARLYLNKKGYYLRKFRKIVRFKKLKSGDKYFCKNKLYTKE